MANCENLCTAAKCEELELRILELEGWLNALEGRLINLEVGLDEHVVKLDEHVAKPTSQAHTWDIGLWMSVFYDSDWNDINVRLQLIDSTESVLANVWQYTDYLPFLLQEDLNNHINQGVSLAHNWDINLETQIDVRTDETGNYLDYSFSFTNGTTAFRTVNGFAFLPFIRTELFQLHLDTPIPEAHAYNPTADDVNTWLNQLDFFFRIDDLANNDWDFVITIGDRSRSQILNLPSFSGGGGGGGGGDSGDNATEEELPPANLSLNGSYDIANNDINITVTVNGKSASTTINLDDMPFDNIQNILDLILSTVTNPINETIEIGKCVPPKTEGENVNGYSTWEKERDLGYSGEGLTGINAGILALDEKLTRIHQDVCAAVDPPFEIPDRIPTSCFLKEEEVNVGAIINTFSDYLQNGLFAWLTSKIPAVGGIKGIAISWFVSYMSEILFAQQKEIGEALCITNNNVKRLEELINEIEPISAIPEWWQVRAGADRPQLIVIYREKDGNSKWSLSIPHYNGGQNKGKLKLIPSYTKGNISTILYLNDNSKVIVNANSIKSGESVVKRLSNLINSNFLKNSIIKTGGERKGAKLKSVLVEPAYAKYFSAGQENTVPDWTYNFKTEKFHL